MLRLLKKLALSNGRLAAFPTEVGYSLGATPLCMLSENWSELRAGQQLVFALAGAGGGRGSAVLSVEEVA